MLSIRIRLKTQSPFDFLSMAKGLESLISNQRVKDIVLVLST